MGGKIYTVLKDHGSWAVSLLGFIFIIMSISFQNHNTNKVIVSQNEITLKTIDAMQNIMQQEIFENKKIEYMMQVKSIAFDLMYLEGALQVVDGENIFMIDKDMIVSISRRLYTLPLLVSPFIDDRHNYISNLLAYTHGMLKYSEGVVYVDEGLRLKQALDNMRQGVLEGARAMYFEVERQSVIHESVSQSLPAIEGHIDFFNKDISFIESIEDGNKKIQVDWRYMMDLWLLITSSGTYFNLISYTVPMIEMESQIPEKNNFFTD